MNDKVRKFFCPCILTATANGVCGRYIMCE